MIPRSFPHRLWLVSLTISLLLTLSDFAIAAKFVILAGGLPGSGKRIHMKLLSSTLHDQYGQSVLLLDKDAVAQTMPRGATSAEIYTNMMQQAEKALEDVIIHEGNIIANLSLFKDYILSEHKRGTTVVLLEVDCKDGDKQHVRLVARNEQRDEPKFNYAYYIQTDRPKETGRRDKEMEANNDLFSTDILKHIVIDNTHDQQITPPGPQLVRNVQAVIDDLESFKPFY